MYDLFDLPDSPADVATNPELLAALLTRWRPYLIVVARRRMGGRPLLQWGKTYEAEDFAQEALFRASRYLRHYDPARGTFRRFLCLQLATVFVEVFRLAARQSRSRRPAVAFRDDDALRRRADPRAVDPVATAAGNDAWDRAGRTLEPEERAILHMRVRDGLEWQQIGATLGITRDAAWHRFLKAKKKVAADL